MGFDPSCHKEVCDEVYVHLAKLFPEFEWTVLPEIEVGAGRVGVYINASVTLGGYPANVCCRPGVPITKAVELLQPRFLRNVVDAFMVAFKRANLIESYPSSYILDDSQECPTITLK